MKKSKKIAGAAVACALAATVAIGGTLAFLTSTDSVTNTFTVGNVKITMDEAKTNDMGEVVTGEDAGRVQGNSYKIIPGHEYTKDPTITVDANSEDCYLFVKITNGLANLEAKDTDESKTSIAAQLEKNGWTAVAGVPGVYAKTDAVNAKTTPTVKVFDTFTIADNADLSAYQDGTANVESLEVKVQAGAIQADGFDSAAKAWDEAGKNLFD